MIGQWTRRLGFDARQGHSDGALNAFPLTGGGWSLASSIRTLGARLWQSTLGKGLLAGCASVLLASGASPVQAAAYATDGTSLYRDQVLWLTWGGGGPNGTAGQVLNSGATSSATRTVAGGQTLNVNCTLGNVTHDTSGAVLSSYRPGNYHGDSLNLGYNIGGASNNQLVSGIARNGGSSTFQVTCAATLGVVGSFQIKGLVMADAESIDGTTEYVQATAKGQWHVVEMRKNGGSGTYNAIKTGTGQNGATQTIRFGPGTNQNTAAVTFLAFDQQAYGDNDQVSMDFDIRGSGTTAIAIGLLVPYADFGDAPSSYGEAMHLIDDLRFGDDRISANGANVNLNASSYDTSSLGLLTPPSNYLGTVGPDAESASRYNPDGTGDEGSGSAGLPEENAWPAEAVTVLQAGRPLNRSIVCNGTGTVVGWIDFNRNGSFESAERAQGACSGGQAALSWTVPALANLVAGETFVRLRYATDAAEVAQPTGLATTGEVEDHRITIVAPELSLAKTSNAGSAGWVVGQSNAAYTLTVNNQGQIATNETAGDEVGRITVLDQLPAGILPNWTGTRADNGWSCTFDASRLVTCVTTQIIAAKGTSTIQLPVQVTAAAVGSPINYASVGGGRDLNNGGDPPTPGSSCSSHCASVGVTVKAPAITVGKTASPASGADVYVGDVIAYTLSVTVADTATLSPVVLSDTLGTGLTFGAVTANTDGFTLGGSGNQRTFTLAAGKAPGTYSLSYTATVASDATTAVQNAVTASGGGDPQDTNAPGPNCTSCSTTHNILKPSLTIDKTAASPSGSTVGSTIAYEFLVTNTGNIALDGIAVVDNKLATAPVCQATTLAAGANMTCTGTYTLTQADIDAGEVENSAYARGTPSGSQTTIDSPPDSVTTTIEQNPSLTSAKALTSNADEDGSNSVTLNDTLTYTVTVTNTGNLSLTNVVVSDSKIVPATRTCSSVAPSGRCELVGTYTVTQADVNAGKVLNTATVTTDTPSACASGSSDTVCKPSTEVSVEAYEIEAANDSYGPVNGHEGGNPGNVLDNDSLNGSPVVPSEVVLTANDPAPNDGVTLNADGSLQVAPGTPAGTYTIPYQICERANPANCATAQATVVVGQATIAASNDGYPQVDGAAGDDNVGNVLGNDSLNGEAIDPAEVELALIGSLPAELTFDASTGVVGVKPGTPARDYSFQYKICEKLNAQNCATANVTVSVEAADIVATDDAFGPVNGRDGGDLPGNVLDNDTLGGDPVDPSKVTLTPNDPAPNDGVTLNSDGSVSVEPNTPAGQYPITYQICEILNPSNCDTATVTVTVEAPPIDASDDGFGPVNGSDGNTNIGNVLDNDTLGGELIVPGDVQLEVVGNLPPGLTFDADSGVVGVQPDTPAGDYSFQYEVCEKLNPANCDTASVTVTVEAAPILAENDAYGPINQGAQGVPLIGNVLDNDRFNGAVVTPQDVTLSGTPPAELSFDPSTGAVGVNPGTPAGQYSFDYRICEKLNPSNCADATVTVEVQAMAIAAIDDDYTDASLTNGAQGGVAGNVLGNDSLNGLGGIDLAQVRLEQIASSVEQVRLDPASGDILVAPGTPAGTYTLRYRLIDRLNPGNFDEAVVTVAVSGDTLLNLTKQATPQQVKIGDLVRYTLVADNTSSLNLDDVVLLDSPPAGFSLVADSLSVSDRNGNWSLGGVNPIRVSGLSVAAGGRISITYFLRVGAGAAARGEYVNTAQLLLNGLPVSNNARASVTRAADPLFEDSRVWGTVFHDRDGDSWQDSAKATGLQVSGGFAPDAYVANSTSVDRGEGPQPEADASSPLLHGLQLGTLEGRRSPAEPENARRIVISQRLREPAFTDDFSLSTAEGTLLRMNAAGEVSVERRGDAARGLTGQDLSIERRLSPAANGEYRVDYIIVNRGINERGLPGVRIGTVEGLLVETDAYGRFHLEGLNVEHIGRGRNFIMKVDAATLPAGSRFTSENPLVKRITQGMPTRFDFAVQVPEALVAGSEMVEVELGEVLFEPGNAEIRDADRASVAAMQAALRRHGGGEVNIVGHAEDQALALRRAEALRAALLADLSEAERERVTLTLRPESGATLGLRGERVLLGQVLFGTDQARLRSEYAPLLDELARLLAARLAAGQSGAELVITGHADARGSAAYNQALGMRRARVVFDALAARLSVEQHSRLRVEIDHGHDGEGAR